MRVLLVAVSLLSLARGAPTSVPNALVPSDGYNSSTYVDDFDLFGTAFDAHSPTAITVYTDAFHGSHDKVREMLLKEAHGANYSSLALASSNGTVSEEQCRTTGCTLLTPCCSRIPRGAYPTSSAIVRFNPPEVCCPFTRSIPVGSGGTCSVTSTLCLDIRTRSQLNAFASVPCRAGVGVCLGMYLRLVFDVSIEITAQCSYSFTYERAKEITLFNAHGISGVAIPAFSFTFDAGLQGSVKMKLPGTVIMRPDWFPHRSSVSFDPPEFEWALTANAQVAASIAFTVEANAMQVVSGGVELRATAGAGASVGLGPGGPVGSATLVAGVAVNAAVSFFSLSLPLPSLSLCDAPLLDFGTVELIPDLGTQVTLFSRSISMTLSFSAPPTMAVMIARGATCSSVGCQTVTSASSCRSAARELELADTSAATVRSNYWRSRVPYGCYHEVSTCCTGLWFNPRTSSTADGTIANDAPICQCPATMALGARSWQVPTGGHWRINYVRVAMEEYARATGRAGGLPADCRSLPPKMVLPGFTRGHNSYGNGNIHLSECLAHCLNDRSACRAVDFTFGARFSDRGRCYIDTHFSLTDGTFELRSGNTEGVEIVIADACRS